MVGQQHLDIGRVVVRQRVGRAGRVRQEEGVSLRTFFSYFSGKEDAVIAREAEADPYRYAGGRGACTLSEVSTSAARRLPSCRPVPIATARASRVVQFFARVRSSTKSVDRTRR